MNYKHFHLSTDEDQIAWVVMDRAGASVNAWDREVFEEFASVIAKLERTRPAGMVLTSGKKKGFIAGADISQFTKISTAKEAYDLIRQSQLILDQLEALPFPTVALINGFCLGGGLEAALACRYRIAEDKRETRIGLPEVKLGLHPGWGGTVRLPRLIGSFLAMRMILPGADVSAKVAAKQGIVDAAVSERELKRAARYYILKQPKPHRPRGLAKLSNAPLVRPLLGKLFERIVSAKVKKEHYPAPYAVIRNWVKEGVGSRALKVEAESIARLMVTDTSRNLVRVFFLQTRLKSLARVTRYKPKHIHVIGAGTMGGDIAAWCALRGMRVTLQDRSAEQIAPAIQRAYCLYKKKLKKPRLIQAVMDRLQPDVGGDGVSKADVVIEAIFEDLAVKQDLLKKIEPQLKSDAILATNTSSIPLDEMNTVLMDPSRLLGIHFFNPVDKMPLVEVVSGHKTADEVLHKGQAFVGAIGRLPLPVKSKPGFLVNRVLMPYLMEAMTLLEKGYSANVIDQAALNFGMPMGPIALADKVGLDVCLSVAENLVSSYGGVVSDRLKEMVKAGKLGCKSGEGFYLYRKGKPIKSKEKKPLSRDHDLSDRLIFRLLNESVACLHEGLVDDADLLDAGMIFGTGFAPFRGGPLHYAKQRGVVEIVKILERFSSTYSRDFKPYAGWDQLFDSTDSDADAGSSTAKTANPDAE